MVKEVDGLWEVSLEAENTRLSAHSDEGSHIRIDLNGRCVVPRSQLRVWCEQVLSHLKVFADVCSTEEE